MQTPESSRAGPGVPIETKFHAPALREKWVERAGLIQSLAGATAAKLVLVEAPAGFGKTTLVAQWRAGTLEKPAVRLDLARPG